MLLGWSWQKVTISSGNGLAPTRWQEVIWTNAGPIRWRIYAALEGEELTIVTDTNEWLANITAYGLIGCFCLWAAAYPIDCRYLSKNWQEGEFVLQNPLSGTTVRKRTYQ